VDPLAERLKRERVARGLSTAELANQTKVREPYIVALERGMYNVLPAVYVRSFVKTLAGALQIPPHETQKLIHAVLDDPDTQGTVHRYQPEQPPSSHYSATEQVERTSDTVSNLIEQSKSGVQGAYAAIFRKKRNVKNKMFVIGGIVLLLGIVAYVVFENSSGDTVSLGNDAIIEVGSQDSIRLLAIADDTSEFTITIDNKRNEKVLLVPNNEYTWGAMDRFVINNIFNAGSIRFSRNGEPFRQFAKSNEVLRELTITRKDVIASNSPVRQSIQPSNPDSARAVQSPKSRDSVRTRAR